MKSSFSCDMARMSRLGYRFHPTDEELFNHYLRLKNQGQDDDVQIIAEVPICKYEPWDLPDQSKIRSNDRVWFFFSRRDYKYQKSKRSNRTTERGYWKPTGKLRKVISKSNKKQIGTKRTLVFYSGRPQGTRTGWVKQEYEYNPDSNSKLHDQGDFVLYKVKCKPDQITTYGEGECPPVVTPSEFNQTPYGKGDWLLDSNLENHISPYVKGDSLLISSFENQVSASGDSNLSPSMISFDFRCKSPHEEGDCLFTSDLDGQISDIDIKCLLASPVRPPYDFEDQSIYEKDDCLKASDLEHQISDIEFGECERKYPSPPPPCFEDQSTFYKDEPNDLLSYYLRNISSVDRADILVSKEGESSSLEVTPSDFANQNQFQKTDMQNLFGVGMFDSELMANLPA